MSRKRKEFPNVVRAIDAAGGPTKLAEALVRRGYRTSQSVVSKWRRRNFPHLAVPHVHAVTGIPLHELDARLYAPPGDA